MTRPIQADVAFADVASFLPGTRTTASGIAQAGRARPVCCTGRRSSRKRSPILRLLRSQPPRFPGPRSGVVPARRPLRHETHETNEERADLDASGGRRSRYSELSLQPIDFLGETELSAGRYTYSLDVDNGQLILQLEKVP